MQGVKLNEYLTSKEAAKYLGVNIFTFKNWVRNDKIPSFKHPISGYRLFRKEDLNKLFIEEYE